MPAPDGHPAAPPLLSIFILSSAALGYEVLLVRLFSIIHWHHFAFMVISIALLGYGASGSFITLFRRYLLDNYDGVFILNILLFGLSAPACFIAVQQLPFNTLEILWDSTQWLRLLLSYLLLTLPFFFAANAIALSMMRFNRQIALVYGVDLMGAGFGALSIMLLLHAYSPQSLLRWLAIAAIGGAILTLRPVKNRQLVHRGILLVCTLFFVLWIPSSWLELRLSQYKGLSQTLLVKQAELLSTQASPLARTDVVKSPLVPFRHAPGLSLQSPSGPPEQLAVFRDGDEMTTIDRDSDAFDYYNYMSSALPYHLQDSAGNALILDSATGSQILQAHSLGIAQIDAVEADTKLSSLITDQYADYSGWAKLNHKVTIHPISARGFAASAKQYDLVIIGPSGGSSGGSAGVYALSTSYHYTVEALQAYLKLLAPDGLLSITLWTSNPPRDNLKILATAVSAMKTLSIENPQHNIAWIRSWNTATLVLKNSALTPEQTKKVREFSDARSFDLAWLPDIRADEVNRFQLLQEPLYYLAARALLDPSAQHDTGGEFIRHYKYNLQPATDNRPFFNNYFKWSSLQEFLSLPGQSGIAMIGVGYPTLLLTLVQSFVATIVLILLPLAFIRKTDWQTSTRRRVNIVIYFLAIGLAFLFIEIAFIQKFTLILSQPLYAVAVTLCAFLIFSGLGSLYVQQRLKSADETIIPTLLRRSVIMIGLITLIYSLLLPMLSNTIMALSESTRILSAFVLAAPLAFAMGMPFPLGMAGLQQNAPQLIPWAWGINGCASVLSAIIAVLLAIEIGFNGVMICAALLYVLAWRFQR